MNWDVREVEPWIWFRCVLCLSLAVLHVYWWGLFLKIFAAIVSGEGARKAGDRLVEGEKKNKKKN